MIRAALPHPACCAAARRFVALRYASDVLYAEHARPADAIASYRATAPRWTLLARDFAQSEEAVTILICPFCVTGLPSIRLRGRPPRRIRTVIDGGYYCSSCDSRLQECRCAPAERLWEATP